MAMARQTELSIVLLMVIGDAGLRTVENVVGIGTIGAALIMSL